MRESSRGPRAAAGVRGRDKSLPYDQRRARGQPGSRNHPDGRRAGCPHPAGPCGGARSRFLKSPRCGGRERPPYRTGENIETNRENAAAQTSAGGYGIRPYETARPAANRGTAPSAVSQTSVGDDACIVPGTPRCRKACGRAMALPYKPSEHDRPNRTAATTRAAVGRDALIPPEPALPQTPTGGYGIRPYETARPAANRGTAPSAVSQTSVGDDACIVPGTPRCRKACGRAMALPYKPSEHDRPNRTAATTRAAVGRDALIPPDPAAKQHPNFELQRKVRRAVAFSGPPPSSCIPPARRA